MEVAPQTVVDVPTRQVNRIYLDYAATSPLLPEAHAEMEQWLLEGFGNPSSLHAEGRKARGAIDLAREIVSGALGCLFAECLFTSGGTEAANLAILGIGALERTPRKFVFGAAEHHCVLSCAKPLARLGHEVVIAPVDRWGLVDLSALESLASGAALISVQHANNEIGTIQPVEKVAEVARRNGAMFHCDAVQTFLNLPNFDFHNLEADFITISAHKVGGPKAVGAIVVRAGVKPEPILLGGGQEREMRGGTENVAGIAGFGAAVRARSGKDSSKRVARDAFLDRLIDSGFVPTVPDRDLVLDGHAHGRFPGIDAETALIRLDQAGIAASSGAACSSGSLEPSHVLAACGYTREECREGLRFTFGPDSTIPMALDAADRVSAAIEQIRRAKRT